MPRLTNHTREVVDFIVSGAPKNGVPPTESLLPGETREINAVENATYKGRIAAGMVSVATDPVSSTGNGKGAQPVGKE